MKEAEAEPYKAGIVLLWQEMSLWRWILDFMRMCVIQLREGRMENREKKKRDPVS